MSEKIKAVFFDRDGTLIHEKPGTYLSDPAKVRPYKSVRPALALLKKHGYKFFIVSNQSGIGRGYFTADKVNACHQRLKKLLKPHKNYKYFLRSFALSVFSHVKPSLPKCP